MLTVTDPALKHLAERIKDVEEPRCYRMIPQNEEIGLALQSPEPDDTKFSFEGRTVLALPTAMADACSKRTLDINPDGDLVLV